MAQELLINTRWYNCMLGLFNCCLVAASLRFIISFPSISGLLMVMVTETFTGPRGKRVSDKSAVPFNDPNIFLKTCHVYFVKIYNFPLILW